MATLTEPDTDTEDAPRARRRPTLPIVLAIVLALAGVGLTATDALRDTGSPAAENRAVLDDQATTSVVGDVSSAVAGVFTYKASDVAATEKKAADLLTGRAAEQYRALFAQVKQRAAKQDVDLTTRVVRAGAVRLTDSDARLLVFIDQTATRGGQPLGKPTAAQLAITARKSGDRWVITGIESK